jgi:hypothetical protein
MKRENAICVFLSREPQHVAIRTIHYVQAAAPDNSVIDLLVNGNPELASGLAGHAALASSSKPAVRLRVWAIELPDKANAWNQYIHQIWSGEHLALFVDGYVMPFADAMETMVQELSGNGRALGATGVPSSGRTAKRMSAQMQQHGGFHGNLCAIKGSAIARLKVAGVRIPVGLYRTDALMGALLYFDLDPPANHWDLSRIAVVPAASWATDPKHWWRLSDLRSQLKRRVRQSRGLMENLAVKEHFLERRMSAASLPPNASDLVRGWAARNPVDFARTVALHPLSFTWLARAKTRAPDDSENPVLLFEQED